MPVLETLLPHSRLQRLFSLSRLYSTSVSAWKIPNNPPVHWQMVLPGLLLLLALLAFLFANLFQ